MANKSGYDIENSYLAILFDGANQFGLFRVEHSQLDCTTLKRLVAAK